MVLASYCNQYFLGSSVNISLAISFSGPIYFWPYFSRLDFSLFIFHPLLYFRWSTTRKIASLHRDRRWCYFSGFLPGARIDLWLQFLCGIWAQRHVLPFVELCVPLMLIILGKRLGHFSKPRRERKTKREIIKFYVVWRPDYMSSVCRDDFQSDITWARFAKMNFSPVLARMIIARLILITFLHLCSTYAAGRVNGNGNDNEFV